MKKYIFTDQEKEEIKAAVQALEKESCGEIVPVFTRSSDAYSEVPWRLSCIMGLSTLALIAGLSLSWQLPNVGILEISLAVIGTMAIGFILPILIPILKRFLVSREQLLSQVERGAKEAFLEEKVFDTEERVGILIYVSRLEHIVMVLGDEGINQKVNPEDWEEVVSLITAGLKNKEIGVGLVHGIEHCKKLLLEHGFTRKDSDYNELSDDLRIKD